MLQLRNQLIFLLCAGLPCAAVYAAPPELTVSEEELKQFPLKSDLPGDPPESGVRYWSHPFKSIGIYGAYVTVIQREGALELWRGSILHKGTNTEGRLTPNYYTATPSEKVCMVSRGPNLDSLGNGEPRFSSAMINDVFLRDTPAKLSPERGFSRTHMAWIPGSGYVFYCCVTRGYRPGQEPLSPALFTSPSGARDSWTYRGKMRGEPLSEAAKRTVWSDGGSIHHLDDGRWRAYINGYGRAASAIESEALTGEWTFLRDSSGAIRELLPDLPQGKHGSGVWIHVLRVAAHEWHLWLTDSWPPQAIWHFSSTDGLDWKPYGLQPEITRLSVGGHGIKCMRTYLDTDTHEIVGLLSVWTALDDRSPNWVLHRTRMPTGLQPTAQD